MRSTLLSFPRGIAKARIHRFLGTLLGPLGESRIRLLVEHQAHFCDLIPRPQWERWREQARPLRGFAHLLSEDDFYQCIPKPIRALVESYPEGRAWLFTEMAWLRKYLTEDGDDRAKA